MPNWYGDTHQPVGLSSTRNVWLNDGLNPYGRSRPPSFRPARWRTVGNDDLRGERQRGDHDPRGDGTVVRAERGATGVVVEELPLYPVHDPLHPAGAVAGRQSPAVLPVAGELQRVMDRVGLVHESRLPAVLEVVAPVVVHEGVTEAAEVNPQVRGLLGEQRPGVEQLAAVELLPLVRRAEGGVALRGQRVRRRAQAQHVQEQSLVVALPAVREEAA